MHHETGQLAATLSRLSDPIRFYARSVPESAARRLRRRVVSGLINRAWGWARSWGAIVPGTAAGDRFGSFGEGSLIGFPPAALQGEGQIHIGRDTLVCAGSTLATGYTPDQVDVPSRALVIGDRCLIGLRCGLVAHESIEVGDDVWFGQDVYVTDSNHGFDDLHRPIGKQLGTPQAVTIGSGSWVGHGAIVLPGTRIGRNCVVAAGSVVRGVVPDFSLVAGVPGKVVRVLTDGDGQVPDLVPAHVAPLGEPYLR
jgi:carbonic anhydrase/acetyltransferase-like protein (isoleucine patch superfamily)